MTSQEGRQAICRAMSMSGDLQVENATIKCSWYRFVKAKKRTSLEVLGQAFGLKARAGVDQSNGAQQ